MDGFDILRDEGARLQAALFWEASDAELVVHAGNPKYLDERSLRWRLGVFIEKHVPERFQCRFGNHKGDILWRSGSKCLRCGNELPRSVLSPTAKELAGRGDLVGARNVLK